MVKSKEKDVDDRILDKWYSGVPRSEIESSEHVSSGYISKKVGIEGDLIDAQKVANHRRAASQLRHEGHDITKMRKSIRFASALAARNKDLDEVIEAFPIIDEICTEHKVTISELSNKLRSKLEFAAEIEEKIRMETKELGAIRQQKAQALAESKCTTESILKVQKRSRLLKLHGLSDDDEERLANALVNFNQCGQDLKEIVRQMSENKSLAKRNQNLAELNHSSDKLLARSNQALAEQTGIIQKNSVLVTEVERLGNMGCGLELLGEIRRQIESVASAKSIPLQVASKAFVKDIKSHYVPLRGLQDSINTLKVESDTLNANLEVQRKRNFEYSVANRAVQDLIQLNLRAGEIVAAVGIIKTVGNFDIDSFAKKVAAYGTLDSTLEALDARIQEGQAKWNTLQEELPLLANRKAAVEQTIHLLEYEFAKAIKSMIIAVRDERQSFVQDAASKAAALDGIIETLDMKIALQSRYLDELTKKCVFAQGIVIFEPLIRAAKNEVVDVMQLIRPVVFAMNILCNRLRLHSESREALSFALKAIQNDVEFILEQ
jgi:hypothetical protein